MKEIQQRVHDLIDKARKDADNSISDEEDDVNRAQGAYDSAIRTLEDKEGEVDSANEKFDSAIRNLDRKQQDVNKLCQIKTCHSSKPCVLYLS